MKKARCICALIFLFATIAITQPSRSADISTPQIGGDVVGDISFVYKMSRDRNAQRSLFAKQLYLEKDVWSGLSVFLIAFHDQEFKSLYFGVTKKLHDFQFGLGIGPARFEGATHTTVNPWLHYHGEVYEGLYSLERFRNESDDPWYHKGYFQRRFGNHFVGIYGEKDIGVGPMVGTYIGKKSKVWVSIPTVKRPEAVRIKIVGGLVFEF